MPPSPVTPGLRPITLTRWDSARGAVGDEDVTAVEEPLELRIGGRSLAVLMRTPGHDRDLALGFLITEGILAGADAVLDLVYCADGEAGKGNVLDAVLAPGVTVEWDRLQRHSFASSSCGLCGKASIEAVRTRCAPLRAGLQPDPGVLVQLPQRLRAAQASFAATGAVHASGLFSAAGELEVLREDVGRHNALDKVVGWAAAAGRLPLDDRILLVSGRVSFELMQKALAAGIPCVAGISAPTSLAVDFAREAGQTLVGFLRGDRMNVYAGTLGR
jgi:FdhD protein